jgi:hypothetical protein
MSLPDGLEVEVPGDPAVKEAIILDRFARNFIQAAEVVRGRNDKWWHDIDTGAPLDRNVGELLMLIVSEIAEAMEGHRKNLLDDKLPAMPMFDVEIADVLIRLLDLAAGLGRHRSIAEAFFLKMEYNRTRADHQIENRRLPNGKKY